MIKQVPVKSGSYSIRLFLNIWDFIYILLERRTLQYAGVLYFRSSGRTTLLLSAYNFKVISPEKLLQRPRGKGGEGDGVLGGVRRSHCNVSLANQQIIE